MDAFAVSVTNGICYRDNCGVFSMAMRCGATFGLFQAVMPLIGYLAGHAFLPVLGKIDHWIALCLMWLLGGRMLWAGIKKSDGENPTPATRLLTGRELITQALATSVDALAAGVGLGVVEGGLWAAASAIGLVTFFSCFCGVLMGRFFGSRLKDTAQLMGGVMIMLIGFHIFAEDIGLFSFLFGFGPVRW
jgi:putative Mn2+ efflux pump MntP